LPDSSLTFGQSADEKDVFTVSIGLKHCPRPGLMALLSEATNGAGATAWTAGLTNARPRKAG